MTATRQADTPAPAWSIYTAIEAEALVAAMPAVQPPKDAAE